MKIILIGGGMEPGADGVGDYMRMLGAALVEQGVEVRLLSLHDGAVQTKSEGNAGGVDWLRLPAGWPWARRLAQAEAWIQDFNPDWVSLQCVVFSFDVRGLPFGLGARWARLVAGRKVHLMFHEIAMGFNPQAPWRHRVYGALQRRILQDIARRTRPLVAHTTTIFYQTWLARAGIVAGLLPLHGNVPVAGTPEAGRRWLKARLGLDDSPCWLAGFFGGFSPMLDLAQLARWVERQPCKGRGLVILSAGRVPPGAEAQWKDIERTVAGAGRCVRLGPLPAAEVSRYLHGLDEGLTTYPPELTGKSGAVAAMFAHGLEVTPLGWLGKPADPAGNRIHGPVTTAADTASRLLAELNQGGCERPRREERT